MFKTPETTDWQSPADQQIWFDRFATDSNGFKFNQFQDFLRETLYKYFEKYPNTDDKTNVDAKFNYQQEIYLFRAFDSKNDHLIDKDEFAHLCQSWLDKTYRRSCALVVVDVQNDFIDGSLALINGPAREDGEEVVPVINKLIDECNFDLVAYTLDWHPPDHIGFHDNLHMRKYRLKQGSSLSDTLSAIPNAVDNNGHNKQTNGASSHPDNSCSPDTELQSANQQSADKFKLKKLASKVKVFDTVLFDEGRMEQKLWPVHCVQNSRGAQLHPELKRKPGAVYVKKGTLSNVDAYSAFWDNLHLNETNLRQELVARKVSDVFFCGLALDYCVAASALDAVKAGFVTFVIEDACRGIDPTEMNRRKEEMLNCGVLIVNSESIRSYLTHNEEVNIERVNKITHVYHKCQSDNRNRGSKSGNCPPKTDHKPIEVIIENELDRAFVMNICYKRAVAVTSTHA